MLPARYEKQEGGLATVASLLAHNLKESSIEVYVRHIRTYIDFCQERHLPLYAPSSLASWRDHLLKTTKQSPNYIALQMAAVKRGIKELASPGRDVLVPELEALFNKVEGPSVSANRHRLRPSTRILITPEEMRVICDTPDPTTLIGARNRALLATLASSGIRNSELSSLTEGQILAQDGGYVLSVLGKKQTYAQPANLSPEAYERIQAWLAMRRRETTIESPYVFSSFTTRGKIALARPLTPKSIDQIIHKTVEEAGLASRLAEISSHHFRRFVGTMLTQRYGIHAARQALHHRKITTTELYVLSGLPVGQTDTLY